MLHHKTNLAVLLTIIAIYSLQSFAEELEPLKILLPHPCFNGPANLYTNEHLEAFPKGPRAPFLVPKGVKNVALGKNVTSSDKSPWIGSLDWITDGDKDSNKFVELRRRVQWVQIDLEESREIYAILIWRDQANLFEIYYSVIVQVADNAEFTQNVRTLFNNDYDNKVGLGVGKDKLYRETWEGKLIDAKGAKARYVRLYSRGSTFSYMNDYLEVEVYGK